MTKVARNQFEIDGKVVRHVPTGATFTVGSDFINWGRAGDVLPNGDDFERHDVLHMAIEILRGIIRPQRDADRVGVTEPPIPADLPRLAAIVADWADGAEGVRRVFLFGSRVRGDHRLDSDVDIYLARSDFVSVGCLPTHPSDARTP